MILAEVVDRRDFTFFYNRFMGSAFSNETLTYSGELKYCEVCKMFRTTACGHENMDINTLSKQAQEQYSFIMDHVAKLTKRI